MLADEKARERAVRDLETNLALLAGAGCGKTRVLVDRFTEIIKSQRAELVEVVAITFTEKAAKEMKDRLRERFRELRRQAKGTSERRLWRKRLWDLESARISTIHGLAAEILRERAIEAGLDPEFGVLDGTQAEVLLARCLDECLAGLAEEAPEPLLELVRHYALRGLKEIIRTMLADRQGVERLRGIYQNSDDEIIRFWNKKLETVKAETINRIAQNPRFKQAITSLSHTQALDENDKAELARLAVLSLWQDFQEKIAVDERSQLLGEIYQRANPRLGKKTLWGTEEELAGVRAALGTIRSTLAPHRDLLSIAPEEETISARLGRFLLWAYERFLLHYQEAKRSRSLLDFGDLIFETRRLLAENKLVRRHYQEAFKFILVDEFQDTDHLQQEIIYWLAEEKPLADDLGQVKLAPGKLFIVGDEKQSIYGFRGADVTVFNQVAQNLAKSGDCLSLVTSFRPTAKSARFINFLFQKVFAQEGPPREYEPMYREIVARREEEPPNEAVEFLLVTQQEGQKESRARAREREAELIARRIRQMVDTGEPLVWSGEGGKANWRPVRFGDIALLFRALTQVHIYEGLLREYEIPYFLSGGGGFYGRQEVEDLMNFLRALDSPEDEVALVGALRSPLVSLSDEGLYWLGRSGSLANSFLAEDFPPDMSQKDQERLSLARTLFKRLRPLKNRLPISRLLERILDETGYDAVVLGEWLGQRKLANLLKLLEIARSFDASGLFSLSDFTRFAEIFAREGAREAEAPLAEEAGDAVRIMSIHKAKGLQFPVVFIPDISRLPRGRMGPILLEPEIGIGITLRNEDFEVRKTLPRLLVEKERARREVAEEKRLFYVASTRHQDYLVYSGFLGKSQGSGSCLNWLREAFDLERAASEGGLSFAQDRIKITTDLPGAAPEPVRRRSFYHRNRPRLEALKKLEAPASAPEIDSAFQRSRLLKRSLTRKAIFSATELVDYARCGLRYHFTYILGLPQPFETLKEGEISGRERGLIVHRIFEDYPLPPDANLADLVIHLAREEGVFASDEVLRQLGAEIHSLLDQIAEEDIFRQIREAKVHERELAFTIALKDFLLRGIMDAAFLGPKGKWIVVDYKTDAIKKSEVEKRAEHYQAQIDVYALAGQKILGDDVGEIVFHFLTPKVAYRTPITPEFLKGAEERLIGLIAKIRHSEFPGNIRECQYCPFRRICVEADGKGERQPG